jgi:hypothetical protein
LTCTIHTHQHSHGYVTKAPDSDTSDTGSTATASTTHPQRHELPTMATQDDAVQRFLPLIALFCVPLSSPLLRNCCLRRVRFAAQVLPFLAFLVNHAITTTLCEHPVYTASAWQTGSPASDDSHLSRSKIQPGIACYPRSCRCCTSARSPGDAPAPGPPGSSTETTTRRCYCASYRPNRESPAEARTRETGTTPG